MDLVNGTRRTVKPASWIAFPVPYTDAVILASVSKGRLSGMIYNPLMNRPPDPWKHDCPHCQQDTSTRWPLKARKALRMLRLAQISRSKVWELELAPGYTFRGKQKDTCWDGTVDRANRHALAIKQNANAPLAGIPSKEEISDMALRHLKMILLARIPPASEIAACLASLEASVPIRLTK